MNNSDTSNTAGKTPETDANEILDELERRLINDYQGTASIVESATSGELDLTKSEKTSIAGEANGLLQAIQILDELKGTERTVEDIKNV